jgi:lipopolysaccharide export system protein LptC
MSPAQQSARERLLEGLRRRNPGETAARAKKNRFVAVSKTLLPVLAVGILIALVMAPTFHAGPAADRITYKVAAPTSAAAANSAMTGAQYRGVDDDGEPFTLTATKADQHNINNIALAQPTGDITLTSGAWLELRSDSGIFDQKLQVLGLRGNVTLYRNDGTTMTGPDAKIDLKGGNATSSSPVQAAGPFGTLTAQKGYAITDRGQDVVFNGPAVLELNQAPGPTAQ